MLTTSQMNTIRSTWFPVQQEVWQLSYRVKRLITGFRQQLIRGIADSTLQLPCGVRQPLPLPSSIRRHCVDCSFSIRSAVNDDHRIEIRL